MAQRKKQSQAEKEYKKELQRIKRSAKRIESLGYNIEDFEIPPKPHKVTQASVRRLKKITAEDIYKQAQYIDLETGEIKTGKAKRGVQITATPSHKGSSKYPTFSVADRLKKEVQTLPVKVADEVDEGVIREVQDSINGNPDYCRQVGEKNGIYSFMGYKEKCLSIIDDNLAQHDKEYVTFIYNNMSAISSAINHIRDCVPSEAKEMESSYIGLMNLLNMNRIIPQSELREIDNY